MPAAISRLYSSRLASNRSAGGALIVRQRLQDLLHDHPSRKSLARVQRVEPAFDGRPRDAGRFQLGNAPAIQLVHPLRRRQPSPFAASERARCGLSRSRLRFTEAACQSFGRTTGTSRPRSSRMIECTACLRNPVAQSRKLGGQVVVADQTARHPRPYPPARIGERRKIAVEDIELKALPCCPCSAGRLIGGVQHDRPAGLARIAPPETAQPVAFGSHLGALDAVDVAGKMRSC